MAFVWHSFPIIFIIGDVRPMLLILLTVPLSSSELPKNDILEPSRPLNDSRTNNGTVARPPPVDDDDDDDNDNPLANFEREEQKYYDTLGQKGDGDDKCDVFYDPEEGKCAWWNSANKKYERPALEHKHLDGIKCLSELHNWIFGHVCGDQLYEQMKHCAKVKFFNNIEPDEGRISEETEDMLLLLIDGCILCIGDNEYTKGHDWINVTLKLHYTLPEGSFFTGCNEEVVYIDLFSTYFPYNASITAGKISGRVHEHITEEGGVSIGSMVGQTTFSFPALLAQRRCTGLFSSDAHAGFSDVTLTVEHNCNNEKPNNPIVKQLSELLRADDFKHNVAELRRLHIDLGMGRMGQFNEFGGRLVKLDGAMLFENMANARDDGF